jgi:hypothetical protein
LIYAWVAANYAGHTKKITINAVVLVAYGAANIIGPLTFTGASAPTYLPAKIIVMATLAFGVVCSMILRQWYVWENKRRDSEAASDSSFDRNKDSDYLDLTDVQNREFRVSH